MTRVCATTLFGLTLSLACGGNDREEAASGLDGGGMDAGADTGGIGGTASAASEDADDSDTQKFDVADGETAGSTESAGGDCPTVSGDATLRGTVFAPNQVIPVSGALVYVADEMPDGIPQTVYCAECVELECGTAFTLTEPDGSFEFEAPSDGRYLVVQKGQFMRITEIGLDPGDNDLGAEVTSLPDHNDPTTGLYIPRIALAWGAYDRLEDALGKLGLAGTTVDNGAFTETFIPGTEEFAVWDNEGSFGGIGGPTTASQGDFATLLGSYPLMEQYHIIFVPCSNDFALAALGSAAVQENIRNWVAAGGKFYASDWSNEFIDQVFPQYQDFFLDSGTADLPDAYDSNGLVLDDDLTAWLDALPDSLKNINPLNGPSANYPAVENPPQIETTENWSGIMATPPVMVDDGMGGQVDVGHKTWIEGPGDGFTVTGGSHPLTVTGQYGCGKILFTTYHMAELNDSYVGLTPQELVLLYLILEIGVCQTPYVPPVPQG